MLVGDFLFLSFSFYYEILLSKRVGSNTLSRTFPFHVMLNAFQHLFIVTNPKEYQDSVTAI